MELYIGKNPDDVWLQSLSTDKQKKNCYNLTIYQDLRLKSINIDSPFKLISD